MSLVKSSTTPQSSHSREMNPSVQPFYAYQSPRPRHRPRHQRPLFVQQRPPRSTMPDQPAFVSKARLNPSAARFEPNILQPSYPTERLEMYQHALPGTHLSFPPQPHVSGPVAPNHNIEALVQDMWKTCPELCQSIRQDFDLNAIFDLAVITLHGETCLRLAASQIAMQNQAKEMLEMRNSLSQKQKLLDVNTASAKDLQAQLVTQQSELSEIRRLLEQQSQSLTNQGIVETAAERQSRGRKRDAASQDVTVSPSTTTSMSAAIDSSIQRFYSRSTSLPPLKLGHPPDNVDKHDEKYGYGHAETHGPAFEFDRADNRVVIGKQEQPSHLPTPQAPVVSTCAGFEPVSTSAKPVVSIGAKKQTSITVEKKGHTGTASVEESAHLDNIAKSTIGAEKVNEASHKPASQNGQDKLQALEVETPQNPSGERPSPPSKVRPVRSAPENSSLTSPNKTMSYAAAIRTTPAKVTHNIASPAKPISPAMRTSPGPDLGFKLEPLPKPTMQQVQSQQQQLRRLNENRTAENVPFNFEEWKQQKIADGTWEDRPRRSEGNFPHQRSYQPGYHGRGFGPRHFNENFRPRPMNQAEYKRDWLAWKQKLVDQGKWNPTHPFREAWKNE